MPAASWAGDDPLKLVIISRFATAIGGAERRMYRFLERVDRDRFDIAVVFLGLGKLQQDVRELGFRTYPLRPARLRQIGGSLRTIGELRRILKSERPDLILSFGAKGQILAWPAASLSGFADRLAWWQLDVPPGGIDMRLATMLPAQVVACNSREVARRQQSQRPHHHRTFVVYPGVDEPREVPETELEELRGTLGIPDGRVIVGTVGRLQTRKRQDLLVSALAALKDRGRDLHGLIVGGDSGGYDPEYVEQLHRRVDELGLSDRVTFTGEVADPIPYVRLMDVFVLTCPVEVFSNALLEAMGCGVACVGINRFGPLEAIEDGRSGLLVEPEPVPMADAIDHLVEDDSFRASIAEEGKRHVDERFTAIRMTRELEERLREHAALVGSKRSSRT